MNYYYDYTNITTIEQNIKLLQAKLKLAKIEKAEWKIEDITKSIKSKRQQLLIAKAKMEINKELLVKDLMLGKEIKAKVKDKDGSS
jgi:hypothetical protein|tara:strand:- start:1069 stop:1326 length:258 start_codon:yes stop_codon:yes gene_type:complete